MGDQPETAGDALLGIVGWSLYPAEVLDQGGLVLADQASEAGGKGISRVDDEAPALQPDTEAARRQNTDQRARGHQKMASLCSVEKMPSSPEDGKRPAKCIYRAGRRPHKLLPCSTQTEAIAWHKVDARARSGGNPLCQDESPLPLERFV